MKFITRVLDRTNINAMVKAVKATKLFTIKRTSETVLITHTKTGKEVFRSLRHGPSWITRYHEKLFT